MIAETAEPLTGSILSWVDLVSLALLGAFLVYGVVRGFMIQLLGIGVLIGSVVLASILSRPLGGFFDRKWESLGVETAKWVAFGIILIVGLAVGTALAHLLKGSMSKAKMLAYDRLLGGAVGLVKGWILAVILIQLALNLTQTGGEPEGLAKSIIHSRSGRIARWSTEKIFVFLPPETAKDLQKYDKLR